MATKKKYNCPGELTLDLIGGRWKPIVLWLLRRGPQRSGKLRSRLPGISPAAFSAAVRELEGSDLIVRESTDTYPPAVMYRLSVKGESLKPLIRSAVKWGLTHRQDYQQDEFGMEPFYNKGP
ncbi:MAG: helix-turn-helix transcriptional regulator [Bdellovibrionales bacterium]|nr:helix-turn-helix transcriptional regulator [Bdellovibrionales bacterium]